jgi:hypothetical protein
MEVILVVHHLEQLVTSKYVAPGSSFYPWRPPWDHPNDSHNKKKQGVKH